MGKTVVEDYDEAKEALTVDEKTGGGSLAVSNA
jgi:hypothetical protein